MENKLLTYLKQCLCFLCYGSLTCTVTNTLDHFIYINIWWTNFLHLFNFSLCFLDFKHVHVSGVLCSTYFSGLVKKFQLPSHVPLNINPCNWLKAQLLTPVQIFAAAPGRAPSSLST